MGLLTVKQMVGRNLHFSWLHALSPRVFQIQPGGSMLAHPHQTWLQQVHRLEQCEIVERGPKDTVKRSGSRIIAPSSFNPVCKPDLLWPTVVKRLP